MSTSLPYTCAAVLSRPGAAYEGIEDRFTILDARLPIVRLARRGAIFAVADGVGSTERAEEAAEVACEQLSIFFRANRPASEDLLLDVIEAADAEVRLLNYGASTLAGIWVARDKVQVFSLGDSSVYRVRGGDLTRLNWKSERRALHTFLGMGENVRPSIELFTHELIAGDTFLLMTDGLFGCYTEEQLLEAWLETGDCLDFVWAVERELDRRGHRDDVTLMAARVEAIEASREQLDTMRDVMADAALDVTEIPDF